MKNFCIILVLIFSAFLSNAQGKFNMTASLRLDPKVKYGKLDNGMTYYIQKNSKPEKRAQLMLAVNVGSIQEDDDQLGLAHFCEHMAFNGTKNFPNNKLDEYLESVGIRNFNAFTSFDMTVYMLEAITDNEEVFSKCLTIVEDWAYNLTLDSVEIDKERGVIIEEWRLGQGAEERMRNKYRPILFKGSRYADRLPIGKKEILENFKYNTLRRFYKEWYRPDMMAVIAIGDFDVDKVEKTIKEHFSASKMPVNPRSLGVYEVPDHKETLIAKVIDKEASRTTVMLSYKHPKFMEKNMGDFRQSIVHNFYNTMLNNRLEELKKQADPPFNFGYTYYGSMAKTKDQYVSYAMVSDKGIERGIETLATENERVKRHGFTSTEFERAKKDVLRQMEQYYNERDKTESSNLAFGYVYHFLNNTPQMGIEKEYELYKQLVPTVKLEEINTLAKKWITNGENLVVVIQAPEKEGVVLPEDDKIISIIKNLSKKDIKPYVDDVITKPLVSKNPAPSKVVSEKKVKEADITEWVLGNGAKVIIKPTDFQNDEIQISAFSFGGWSVFPEKDFLTASNAAGIIQNSGLGEFDKIQLDKYLTGKIASITPYINEAKEGFYGNAAPADVETALQLIYMYFTSPRFDEVAFKSYIERQRTGLQNKMAKPEVVFRDSAKFLLKQKAFRERPMNEEMLKEIDSKKAFEFFKDRFTDASDFTFVFVGNVNIEKFKPLVEMYLGGIPTTKRKDAWKDQNVRNIKGNFEKTFYKGTDQKSSVMLVMNGDFEWTRNNRMETNALTTLVNIKLRDAVREEKGGTYGIYSYISLNRYPENSFTTYVQWGCNPDRVEELVNAALKVVEDIKEKGPEEADLAKVKEIMRKEREKYLKENYFWISVVASSYENNEDVREIYEFDKFVDNLNAEQLKKAAMKYYAKENFAKFILMPEK